jgi:hypothetical protein
MAGRLRGLAGLPMLALAACGIHAEREDPDLFRRKMGEYRGVSSAVHINDFSVPRPFPAVIADVKPIAEGCLNQQHPGNYLAKISATSETGVVTVKSPGVAVLEYRYEGLIFLLADFKAEGGSTKVTVTRSHGYSDIEGDIRLWAAGQSRECSQYHMKLPFQD